jgi:hypothetical protein
MIVRESINFERGLDPKESMNIGNPWTKLKKGSIIECIKPAIVEELTKGEYLILIDPEEYKNKQGNYYIFSQGNVAILRGVHLSSTEEVLACSLIPFDDISYIPDEESLKKGKLTIYSSISARERISSWKEYFKIIKL